MNLCRNIHRSVWQLLGVEKFKMVVVAMVTKVQKMLNSLQTSQIFAVMFPVTSTSSGMRSAKKIGISRTNFAAVAMEIKKRGTFKKNLISFIKLHEAS